MSTQKPSPLLPFARGGISGVTAWLLIHPTDVLKVRMQLAGAGQRQTPYRNVFHAATQITRTEGFSALYSGLSAALTRQLTYTTLRLGLYSTLREKWMERQDGREISGAGKFALGTVAGGLASAVSTPVEVSMVRMYADGTRGRYRHIFDALFQIARDEGLRGLWRGATPTIMRSALANCVQLGTYDHAKHLFMNNIERARDDVPVHLAASATSGFCYSVATLPIDMAKTRLQEQGGGRGVRYGGVFECVWRVGREEGIAALWKGFVPYFSRCAGHTVAMFLVLEQVKKIL